MTRQNIGVQVASQPGATSIADMPTIIVNAREGFARYKKISLGDRIGLIKQLRYALVEAQGDISEVISHSTGKPITEALTTEVMVVVDAMLHVEKRTTRALATEKIKTPITFIGKKSYVEFKPRGVVAVISPWNFPFMLAMIPAIEALAAGNAIIIKPSEVTPAVGQLIGSLFDQAGFPKGCVQVIHGGVELGEALVASQIDFVHFTGSVKTGKAIARVTGPALVPTTLELGGKDPMIVFEDANIKRAVNGAIWGAFSNAGQVCMSVERLYVQNSIYDLFIDQLVREAAKLKLGSSPNDDVGPLTTRAQVEVVKRHVTNALSEGARLLLGDHPDTWNPNSLAVRPIILVDVSQEMEIMQEETFGPVLPIMSFSDDAQAITLANDSRFGLNSSVWTQNLSRGKKVISQLTTGGALINDVILTIANPYLPYGGVKDSGIGSYHSDFGIQNFSLKTSVMVDRGHKLREINWFPYADKRESFETLLSGYWGAKKELVSFGISYLRLLRQSKKA